MSKPYFSLWLNASFKIPGSMTHKRHFSTMYFTMEICNTFKYTANVLLHAHFYCDMPIYKMCNVATMPSSNIAHLSHIDQHSNYFGIIIVSTVPMFKAFVGHPFLINLHPHTYFNL